MSAGVTESHAVTVEPAPGPQGPVRERFLPQRVGQLQTQLAAEPWNDPDDAERFRSFGRLVSALYHYEFHEREQAALDAWEAMADDPEAAAEVTAELSGLLDGANYSPIGMTELEDAMERESLIQLRLEVDLDDYDEVLIYRRGAHTETITVPRLKVLKQDREITVDERVVVHTRVKDQAWFDERGIDPAERNLIPGHASLKLFQNVPRADIEMLLPSADVKFRTIDTIVMGVPALVSGLIVLTTRLAATLGLIALLVGSWVGLRDEAPELDQAALVVLFGGAVTLGGFSFRQWNKFKNRRVQYLKTLSEALYFRTLADGPGVVHTLLAAAEQQEVSEVLLAYRFLLAQPSGRTEADLDAAVEAWLRDSFDQDVDFEVDDAVAKLERLGAVVADDGLLRPVPLPQLLAELDRRWDDLFNHRPPDPPGLSTSPSDLDGRTSTGGEGSRSLIRLRQVVDRFAGRVGHRVRRRR